MNNNGRILVFARTPEMGKVKTRLQPVLGEAGCYQLHEMLVNHTVETAIHSEVAPVEVWHTGHSENTFWQDKQETLPINLREQSGSDLGERMLSAMRSHLSRGNDSKVDPVDWVILIGSDCPEIDKAYLQKASTALESGEQIVIGPAEDGGYVLIGLREPHSFLFDDIPWGSSSVLTATELRAQENNCVICSLPARRDLDVAADLSYYQSKIPWTNSVSPS